MPTDTDTKPPTLKEIEQSVALIALLLAQAVGASDKGAIDQLVAVAAGGLEALEL